MNSIGVPGIYFRPTRYKPFYAMSSGEMCGGVQLVRVAERTAPFTATIALITTLRDMYPDRDLLGKVRSDRWQMFDKICGTDQIRKMLVGGKSFEQIVKWWEPELSRYIATRQGYLLYE